MGKAEPPEHRITRWIFQEPVNVPCHDIEFPELFLERMRISMTTTKVLCLVTLGLTIAFAPRLVAQVQTEVPPAIPGAKPMTVEHIKVHGAALEGNLEGDTADREVFIFLP